MSVKIKSINLLPKEYIVAEKNRRYKKIGAALLILEVICFVSCVVIPQKRALKATQKELEAKSLEVASARYVGVNKTLNDLTTAQSEMVAYENAYNQIKTPAYVGTELLDELVSCVPEGVSIEILEVKDAEMNVDHSIKKEVHLVGSGDSAQQCFQYISNLEMLFTHSDIQQDLKCNVETGKMAYELTILVPVTDENMSQDAILNIREEGAVE